MDSIPPSPDLIRRRIDLARFKSAKRMARFENFATPTEGILCP